MQTNQRKTLHSRSIIPVILALIAALSIFNLATTPALAQANAVVTVSAASFRADGIAPEAIVAAFGTNLATTTARGTDTDPNTPGIQLPTTLGGTTVRVNGRLAELIFVSPLQINYVIPAATTPGAANVEVAAGNGATSNGVVQIILVAPAIFSANSDGSGVPAAVALRVRRDNSQVYEAISSFNTAANRVSATPINLGPEGERVFLILFLTGIRRTPDPNNDGNFRELVRVIINGIEVAPAFAGKQGEFVGLDQINVEIPRSLLGSANLDVTVVVNGYGVSNTLRAELNAPPITNLNWRPLGLPNRVIRQFAAIGSYLFSATDQGVFCSGDGGGNWISVSTGLPANVPVLSLIADGSVLYAGLQGGGVCLSRNNGQSWTAINNGLNGTTLTINNLLYFGATLYAATSGGVCFYNGTQWVAVNTGLATIDSQTLLVFNGRLCVGTRGGGIFVLNNNQWGAINNGLPPNAQVLSFASAGSAVYAGLNGGGLCISRNNGATWVAVGGGLPATAVIYSIWVDGLRIYVSTAAGIYVSNDGGVTWTLLSNGLSNGNIYALYVLLSRLLAGSNGGGVFGAAVVVEGNNRAPLAYPQAVTLNQGTTRGITLSGFDLDLDPLTYRIAQQPQRGTLTGTAPNVVYTPNAGFSGSDSFTFTVSDGRLSASATVTIFVIPSNRPPVLTVPGPQTATVGRQLSFTVSATDPDAGQSLSLTTGPLPTGAAFNANTRQFTWTPAANQTGAFSVSFTVTDNGAPPLSDTEAVAITVGGGGTGGGALTWTKISTGLPGGTDPRGLAASGDTLFVTYQTTHGVYRSISGGASWSQFTSGLDTLNCYAVVIVGNNVFLGTQTGVFRSTLNGTSWTNVSNGIESPRSIFAMTASGSTLYAGAFNGKVYRSTDNGANWTSVSNGLPMSQSATVTSLFANGSTLYAGYIGAGFYRSTDSGANWSQAAGGLPTSGFGLGVVQSGTTLFAALLAERGVYRSTDNGATWAQVSNGLPTGTGGFVESIVAVGGVVYVGHLFNGVSSTSDNGATWAFNRNGLPTQTVAITLAANNLNIYLAAGANTGGGSGVYRATQAP